VKFLLDHDVPEDLTYLLRALGHEVLRLRDVLDVEAADSLVLQFADEHGCVLVT
jgi:predicted nuclease of predicted toxin-antitoxin system